MSEWDWQNKAECRGDFGFIDRPLSEQVPVCRRCPVRFECLELGVEHARTGTVGYGGLSSEALLEVARGRSSERRLVWLRCVECSAAFESRSTGSRYCSKGCRQRAYRTRALAVVR